MKTNTKTKTKTNTNTKTKQNNNNEAGCFEPISLETVTRYMSHGCIMTMPKPTNGTSVIAEENNGAGVIAKEKSVIAQEKNDAAEENYGASVTRNGMAYRMKANVIVEPDGTTIVSPYRHGTGKRYRTLFKTSHGEVRETADDVIVKLQFRKNQGCIHVVDQLTDEAGLVCRYLLINDDIKEWQ